MSKKVFELAKELEMHALDLVDDLKQKGFEVRNHMSEVSDDDVKKIIAIKKNKAEEDFDCKTKSIEKPEGPSCATGERPSPETENILILVKGIRYSNSDGTSRERLLKTCSIGEVLFLEREPDNKYDKNAVKVLKKDGSQIGYIPREEAFRIVSLIERGDVILVQIDSLSYNTLECHIKIKAKISKEKEGIGNGFFQGLFAIFFGGGATTSTPSSPAPSVCKVETKGPSTSATNYFNERKNNDSCPGCGGIGCKYCSDEYEDRD